MEGSTGMSIVTRSFAALLPVFALVVVLVGGSGAILTGLAQQGEERARVPPEPTGSEVGLPRSFQPPVYAKSDADTLANLLPGGETAFSSASVAIWRDYLAADYVTDPA